MHKQQWETQLAQAQRQKRSAPSQKLTDRRGSLRFIFNRGMGFFSSRRRLEGLWADLILSLTGFVWRAGASEKQPALS